MLSPIIQTSAGSLNSASTAPKRLRVRLLKPGLRRVHHVIDQRPHPEPLDQRPQLRHVIRQDSVAPSLFAESLQHFDRVLKQSPLRDIRIDGSHLARQPSRRILRNSARHERLLENGPQRRPPLLPPIAAA